LLFPCAAAASVYGRAMQLRPGRLLLGAAILSMLIAAAGFWDAKGVRLLHKLSADAARQEAADAALREQNARLTRRMKQMSGPGEAQALEKAARERLGYVKGDEVLFKFE
jgi:cell division protein FtsB